MTTTSTAGGWSKCLNSSRINRLARFRRTASPSLREATIPSRAGDEGPGASRSVKYLDETLDPLSKTRWNSPRRRTRCALPNACDAMARLHALRRRDGEALAALGAAALEHQAAILGGHPRQKTVSLPAAAAVGLESALHDDWPLLRQKMLGET
jgi:hypothetical protein